MMATSISFGWSAPSFAEQLPSLPKADAERADAFNKAITLLSVHGIITEGERDRAIKRATARIRRVLSQGIEARSAETIGSAEGESPVGPQADAPKSPHPLSDQAEETAA